MATVYPVIGVAGNCGICLCPLSDDICVVHTDKHGKPHKNGQQHPFHLKCSIDLKRCAFCREVFDIDAIYKVWIQETPWKERKIVHLKSIGKEVVAIVEDFFYGVILQGVLSALLQTKISRVAAFIISLLAVLRAYRDCEVEAVGRIAGFGIVTLIILPLNLNGVGVYAIIGLTAVAVTIGGIFDRRKQARSLGPVIID